MYRIIFIVSFALFVTFSATAAAIKITDTMNNYHTRTWTFINQDTNK